MFALMVALVGESIFSHIPGFNGPPEFYYKMKNNPALSGLILFLVLPSYVQSFANTGAFEIYVDEKLVRNYHISIYSSTNVVFFSHFGTTLHIHVYKDLLKISNRKNAEYIRSFQSIRKCRVEEGKPVLKNQKCISSVFRYKHNRKNHTGVSSLYIAVNDKIVVMFQLLSLKVKKWLY